MSRANFLFSPHAAAAAAAIKFTGLIAIPGVCMYIYLLYKRFFARASHFIAVLYTQNRVAWEEEAAAGADFCIRSSSSTHRVSG